MQNFLKVFIYLVLGIGAIFFLGSIYQKIIIGQSFKGSHMLIGFGLIIAGTGGKWAHNAYNGIDNEGQFIGMGFGGIIAIIGLALFLTGLLISF